MASPFDAAMAAADAVIGGTFGEAILVSPRRKAGELKGPTADPARPPVTITGVFTLRSGEDRLGGTRHGTEFQGMTTMSVAPAQVWFSAEELDALPYRLEPDDRITLVDRRGAPSYAIAKRAPTDLDDCTFPLVKA